MFLFFIVFIFLCNSRKFSTRFGNLAIDETIDCVPKKKEVVVVRLTVGMFLWGFCRAFVGEEGRERVGFVRLESKKERGVES